MRRRHARPTKPNRLNRHRDCDYPNMTDEVDHVNMWKTRLTNEFCRLASTWDSLNRAEQYLSDPQARCQELLTEFRKAAAQLGVGVNRRLFDCSDFPTITYRPGEERGLSMHKTCMIVMDKGNDGQPWFRWRCTETIALDGKPITLEDPTPSHTMNRFI